MRTLAVPLAVLSLAAFSYAIWMLDQNVAVRVLGSTHVVYLLLNRHGEPLYIGSTDDLDRRYDQHTADQTQAADPWRRAIAGRTVLRVCRSEAQARRVERRMVRAVTAAAMREVCPRLNNDHWADPPPTLTRPWRLAWAAVYRVVGRLHPERCWDRPNPTPPLPVRWRPADRPSEPRRYDPSQRSVIDVDVIGDASSVTATPTAPVGGYILDDDDDDAGDGPEDAVPARFVGRALPAVSSETPLRAAVSGSGDQTARAARRARQAANSRAYRARKRGAAQ